MSSASSPMLTEAIPPPASPELDTPFVETPLTEPSPQVRPPLSGRDVQKRLFGYLARHRTRLFVGLAAGTIASIAQVRLFDTLKTFIDGLINKGRDEILYACLGVIGLYALMGALKYVQSVSLATVAQHIGMEMRRDVYAHLQSLSLAFFHRRRTGALMSTLTNDVGKLQNAAMMMKDVVTTPILATAILVTMVKMSWTLTIFTLLVVPIMALVIQRLTRRLRGISVETQERLADVSAVMEETIAAPRIVRGFVAEQREIARYESTSRRAVASQLRAVRRSARLGPIVDLLGAIGIAAVLYFGGEEVLKGHMTTGGLSAYLFAASKLADCINAMGSLKSGWEEMMGASDRIFREVLDVSPDIQDVPGARPLASIQGQVTFHQVGFSYLPNVPVLSNINLSVEPGQVMALVGETGSGKTTLADLVPRFYDPTEGKITIDGHDIRTVTVASLRQQIGIVPQDTLLFSGTIRENIAYGRPDATEAEVIAAAQAANAAVFIDRMEDGYNTLVGERGTTLSGGQRQRIAIARALLANPRILILDEATSALDAQTEALVQEALETLMKGRTTIIIAHRLSTIIHADKIVVLRRGGCIAEMGSHAELMARGGVYAALFETQRRSAERGGVTEEGAVG